MSTFIKFLNFFEWKRKKNQLILLNTSKTFRMLHYVFSKAQFGNFFRYFGSSFTSVIIMKNDLLIVKFPN